MYHPASEAVRVDRTSRALHSSLWQERGGLVFLADVGIIFGAFAVGYLVRFHLPGLDLRAPNVLPAYGPYVSSAGILAGLWTWKIREGRGYGLGLLGASTPLLRISLVLSGGVQALIGLMAVSYLFRHLLLSRVVYVLGWSVALVLLCGLRLALKGWERARLAQGIPRRRAAFVLMDAGAAPALQRLASQLRVVEVVGFLEWSAGGVSQRIGSIEGLGVVPQIASVHGQFGFDDLLLVGERTGHVDATAERDEMIQLLNFCEEAGISLYVVPGALDISVNRDEVGAVSGIPLVRLQDAAQHSEYRVVKRIFDAVAAAVLLTVGAPLWLLCGVLVRLTSPGPALYAQVRAGLHGVPFTMWKFRSMGTDADLEVQSLIERDALAEPVFNFREDPRVTAFGRFLRRTSLDEVPQLWNVLRGEMSLVGPRPERVELVARYDAWQARRLKAVPGITGYQQVMSRGEPSLSKRVELDLYYLKHQGPLLDLLILAKTMVVVVRGDGLRQVH